MCFLLLLAVALQSCCIHLWPDQEEEPETPQMVLHLRFNPDLYVWEHLYDTESETVSELYPDQAVHPDYPGTTSYYDNTQSAGNMRHTIRIYPAGEVVGYIDEFTVTVDNRGSSYDYDMPLTLAPGDYDIVVWSDLREHSSDNHFHNTSDFLSINLERHEGNTDYRDAFRGRRRIQVTSEPWQEVTVDMHRPMAKYEFIATGLSDFISREKSRTGEDTRTDFSDYTVIFTYPRYMPCSYSAIDDRLVDSRTGVSFTGEMIPAGNDEVSLGFDYVMINALEERAGTRGSQTVSVMVEVVDGTGETVARSVPISVPLRRDHHTIIKSDFLSEKADGGVAIDPTYDGDHNVFI